MRMLCVVTCLITLAATAHTLHADADLTEILAPPARDDGWPVGDVVSAGLDEERMAELALDLIANNPNIHAVLVEHDGALVYQQYLSGEDEIWGRPLGHINFNVNTRHDLRSITKSITALVLGIALAGDADHALNRPIVAFFPDHDGEIADGVEAITLRHALTMTAGWSWNAMTVPYGDLGNDEFAMFAAPDPIDFLFAQPMREAPGERWYYNGGLSVVLAGVTRGITGRPVLDYADKKLFAPLGITDYAWAEPVGWSQSDLGSAVDAARSGQNRLPDAPRRCLAGRTDRARLLGRPIRPTVARRPRTLGRRRHTRLRFPVVAR
ncbi:MAG: beta-lactamase family protein [Rhodospirillaceae bacterium]|nr:beta-lactamase family protein [Rhodospirillaceae bacterium]MBT6510371.1 beta-lactamase family protein [Rhodospirillaceae bacterium]MBT7614560.1 beta-lactamase family protein [Rhodospirillaceae bacterium]